MFSWFDTFVHARVVAINYKIYFVCKEKTGAVKKASDEADDVIEKMQTFLWRRIDEDA